MAAVVAATEVSIFQFIIRGEQHVMVNLRDNMAAATFLLGPGFGLSNREN